ncbi:transcription elongation factor GreA [Sneathiella glossodoripedis]|uniref:transcription elongation factor GreA n=1 Tax=Sneathiella glossodoripedis TaxID=418853 RepID=UPI00046EF2E8|nr:transcription elongation factor GreA [Sneathiella glossodoripedis]
MERLPITAAGHAKLEAELKNLKGNARPQVIQAIATAREHGDLSENAEYHAAKEQQSLIEGRIAELEDKLGRSEIIDVSAISGKQIKFGATVLLVDEDTDEEITYQIVGEDESNIEEGLLSLKAPLARALLNKEQGDSVEVTTPGGSKAYEVLDVKYI